MQVQLETAKVEVTKPFAQEGELEEKLERLNWLNAQLNMDEKGEEQEQSEEQSEQAQSKEQSEEKTEQSQFAKVSEDRKDNLQSAEFSEDKAENAIFAVHSQDRTEQTTSDSISSGYWTPQEQPTKSKSLIERIADKKAQIETKSKESGDKTQEQGVAVKPKKDGQDL